MGIVLSLVALLPAAIAWGICTGMRVPSPHSGRKCRVVFATTLAGLLPITVPLVSLADGDFPDGLIPFVAVLLVGLAIAVLVGLSVAIRATRNDFPA